MSLLSISAPTMSQVITTGSGETFSIGALTFADIALLGQRHLPELSALADTIGRRVDENATITVADIHGVAIGLLMSAPKIVAEAIATAAGTNPSSPEWDEAVAIAFRLPFPLQADALHKLVKLTFPGEFTPTRVISLIKTASQTKIGTGAIGN